MQQPILVHLGNTIVPGRILVQMGSITGPGVLVTFTPGTPGMLVNTDGVGPGVYVQFDSVAPETPTGLAAFGGVGGAYVQWVTVPFATSYDVQSSSDNVSWVDLSLSQPGTSFSDSVGAKYYRVRATNGSGSSAYTSGAAAGPPLANTLAWVRSVIGASAGTWTDQSGNGNDATQATSGNQFSIVTNVLNGKQVMRAVDANRYMSFPNSLPTGASYPIWSMFKTSATANGLLCGPGAQGTHYLALLGTQFPSCIEEVTRQIHQGARSLRSRPQFRVQRLV